MKKNKNIKKNKKAGIQNNIRIQVVSYI